MKNFIFITFIFFSFQQLCSQDLAVKQAPKIPINQWDIDTLLEKGLTWKYLHTDDFFESTQSISVVEIDLEEAELEVIFGYVDSARVHTSKMAEEMGAITAVNGTFFNMQLGGSVCYFEIEDSVINTSVIRSNFGDEAALAIKEDGTVDIIKRPINGWGNTPEYENIMSAGPILLVDSKVITPENKKFNTNRHPRTAIGLQADGDLVMVTVDGRNAMAQGMSIPELSQLMLALDCVDALNMDGGGSTSMWIKGMPDDGIVNYPSDNGKFDHQGQRTVANIIGLVRRE